jgi:hypothetical protein
MLGHQLGILKIKYPQLHSFAKKKNSSVQQFLIWDDSRSFFLPLSDVAYNHLFTT